MYVFKYFIILTYINRFYLLKYNNDKMLLNNNEIISISKKKLIVCSYV